MQVVRDVATIKLEAIQAAVGQEGPVDIAADGRLAIKQNWIKKRGGRGDLVISYFVFGENSIWLFSCTQLLYRDTCHKLSLYAFQV